MKRSSKCPCRSMQTTSPSSPLCGPAVSCTCAEHTHTHTHTHARTYTHARTHTHARARKANLRHRRHHAHDSNNVTGERTYTEDVHHRQHAHCSGRAGCVAEALSVTHLGAIAEVEHRESRGVVRRQQQPGRCMVGHQKAARSVVFLLMLLCTILLRARRDGNSHLIHRRHCVKSSIKSSIKFVVVLLSRKESSL